MWTKSACVLLAWSIVLIMAAAGFKEPGRPAQANTRNANSTQVIILTSALTAGAPVTAAANTAAKTARHTGAKTARYVVQPGDTLTGIAARFGLHGGWRALYAANRPAIGPDPDVIRTGTVLALPRSAVPARYKVAAGDTLTGIAARFGLHGGWRALYAANRPAIGPDPDIIRTGTVLAIPGAAPARTPRPPARTPAPPAAHPVHNPHQSPPPGSGQGGAPAPTRAPAGGQSRTPAGRRRRRPRACRPGWRSCCWPWGSSSAALSCCDWLFSCDWPWRPAAGAGGPPCARLR